MLHLLTQETGMHPHPQLVLQEAVAQEEELYAAQRAERAVILRREEQEAARRSAALASGCVAHGSVR